MQKYIKINSKLYVREIYLHSFKITFCLKKSHTKESDEASVNNIALLILIDVTIVIVTLISVTMASHA